MLLTILGLLPILAGLLLFIPWGNFGRWIGLGASLVTLAFTLYLFQSYLAGTDLSVTVAWIPAFGAYWALGLDGMGILMVLLTAILVPVVLLAEWWLAAEGRWSANVYAGLVLILEGLAFYVFTANDILVFYLFFEATLIPIYFLIVGYGGPKRAKAAIKFLIYSLVGGLIMLVSIIGLYGHQVGISGKSSYLVSEVAKLHFDGATGRWLMIGFLIAFIIKAPMVPVHTWLPDAAESGTPGTSVLLVAILDKIGTFGMIKFCLGLFPEASRWVAPFMMVLALISIIYGALAAVGSKNLLRLIAYTSVSHFGFMVLGIYAATTWSLSGAIFYMMNHGFSTAALFLVVGFFICRRGSAEIADFGGVQKPAPVLAGLFLIAGLSGAALPGMSSFVSEFLVLAGTWQVAPWFAGIAALGMVLSALYILLAYQKTMTGPVPEKVAESFTEDAKLREKLVMAPLIALILVFGFWPQPMITHSDQTAKTMMAHIGAQDPAVIVGGGK